MVIQLARSGYALKTKYEFRLIFELGGCRDAGIYGKSMGEVIAIANAPPPLRHGTTMSALGHLQTSRPCPTMSALPLEADAGEPIFHVGSGP